MKIKQVIAVVTLGVVFSACERSNQAEPEAVAPAVEVVDEVPESVETPAVVERALPIEPQGGSKHEAVAERMLVLMKELVTATVGVTGLESAEVAARKISGIGDEVVALGEELKPLEVPDEALKVAIDEKMKVHEAQMQQALGEDLQATMEALSPEAREVLSGAFEEFYGKMEAVGEVFERHFSLSEGAVE